MNEYETKKHSFIHSKALYSGTSDIHKFIVTIMKNAFIKSESFNCSYKKFDEYAVTTFTIQQFVMFYKTC